MQKIIIGHGGSYFISESKHEEKQEVLFDALDNILISNSKNVRPYNVIAEKNKKNLYNTKEVPNIGVDSILNSWFHFKLNSEPLNQTTILPGLISKFKDDELKRKYGLTGDENVTRYLEPQIDELAKATGTLIEDICFLISRPCDIAQNKYGRNLKLLSGQKIINPTRNSDRYRKMKIRDKFESIKLYDHLYFSGEQNDVALVFDFRYIFTITQQEYNSKFEKIKVFNKELLSELQVEYSSYSSRLGITQII